MNLSVPESSFKYHLPAFKLILTGVLTAFAAVGCSLAIFNGGLNDKGFLEAIYLITITIICYGISLLNFLNLTKENKSIEIHQDHLVIPNLWSNNQTFIQLRDIEKIEFNDGRSTVVPPYMLITFKERKVVGITAARMSRSDYSTLCKLLAQKTNQSLPKSAA